MSFVNGINNAWLPYYCRLSKKYEKIKHLDKNKEIRKKLDRVYSFGGIMPLYSSYFEMDKINAEILILYSKL